MHGLTARERSLIALALLVGVAALLWVALISPVLAGFNTRREVREQAAQTLAHNQRLIVSYGVLKRQLAVEDKAAATWAVVGLAPSTAAERVRERVSQAVADSGGGLSALRDEPSSPGSLRYELGTQINIEGLQTLLRHLEDDAPYGAINKISIAAPDASAAQHPSTLQVSLDVSFSYIPAP